MRGKDKIGIESNIQDGEKIGNMRGKGKEIIGADSKCKERKEIRGADSKCKERKEIENGRGKQEIGGE